eukprot:Tamp_19604.p1 GENE.Tamp_19604~~Tamp_19604.p1  ORF type:complete len:391 (-),score=70.30 Tamp_19604:77-1144(-)
MGDLAGMLAGAGGLSGLMAMASGGMASGGGMPQPPSANNPAEFAAKAQQAIPAEVHMFSGCRDEQTSADVYDVSSFGLPEDSGPGGAGGACTSAMIRSLSDNPSQTWTELLESMRKILKEKSFTQVPQLSSSKPVDLTQPFDITPGSNTAKKALFIGINYVGQQGELRGCHNDVITMQTFIRTQGFDSADFKTLMDDGDHENPTHDNILAGIDWLVSGAQAGDALFMHYSGHGGSMPDDNGDESDGKDETMVPLDYQSAGQIRDDVIFERLVARLPEGVSLKVVMDCCHSGSILDLPFMVQANDTNFANGFPSQLPPNGGFNWMKAMKVGMRLYQMHQQGAGMSAMGAEAMKMMT